MDGVRVSLGMAKSTAKAMLRGTARLAVVAAALALAACSGDRFFGQRPSLMTSVPQPAATAELTPAQREHQRILASYGGDYPDPDRKSVV